MQIYTHRQEQKDEMYTENYVLSVFNSIRRSLDRFYN